MLFLSKLKQLIGGLKGGLISTPTDVESMEDGLWPEYADKYYKPDSPEVRLMVHHARHCKPSKKKMLKLKG